MSKMTLRCAIYTRKSTEEGLEQGFNSLDTQREACEAFILSQQHEGWKLVPIFYDGGGFSGGNVECPALKQLFVINWPLSFKIISTSKPNCCDNSLIGLK
jgi:site-specific DNA recombinase